MKTRARSYFAACGSARLRTRGSRRGRDTEDRVLLLVQRGRVVRGVHVSTAAPGHHTPAGRFRVYRRELKSWSWQYAVWLPYAPYFSEGHALHGYPPFPRSQRRTDASACR